MAQVSRCAPGRRSDALYAAHARRVAGRMHTVRHNAPLPPEQGPSNLDVCLAKPWTDDTCGQTVFNGNGTFSCFAAPRGIRFYNHAISSVRPVNAELGQDFARLTVSHTHTTQHPWQPGLWFYYARGCSDFAWDMGRTLLVRNRCHLAAVLEQRVHGVGWAAAVTRVAKRMVSSRPAILSATSSCSHALCVCALCACACAVSCLQATSAAGRRTLSAEGPVRERTIWSRDRLWTSSSRTPVCAT